MMVSHVGVAQDARNHKNISIRSLCAYLLKNSESYNALIHELQVVSSQRSWLAAALI